MEINCRPGYRIWCEMAVGQEVPLLCVQIHRGMAVEPTPRHTGRDVFLNPIEDAVSLGARLLSWAARRVVPEGQTSSGDRDPSPRELFHQYRETYRSPHRHFDWYFGALADDPLAALTWYASHLISAGRGQRIGAMTGSALGPRGE
jgi:hypothetical protein